MIINAEDLAYMKGEAAADAGDSHEMALQCAVENGYLAPGPQQDAFIAGFSAMISKG